MHACTDAPLSASAASASADSRAGLEPGPNQGAAMTRPGRVCEIDTLDRPSHAALTDLESRVEFELRTGGSRRFAFLGLCTQRISGLSDSRTTHCKVSCALAPEIAGVSVLWLMTPILEKKLAI